MSSIPAKWVRYYLLAFIAGLAIGLWTGSVLAAQAALILLGLLTVIFTVIRMNGASLPVSKSRSLLLILFLALGLGRTYWVQTDNNYPSQFEAVVFTDTNPTTYGSVTAVRITETKAHVKILAPRYPEFKTGDLVQVTVKPSENLYRGYLKGELTLLAQNSGSKVLATLSTVRSKFLQGVSSTLPEPHASFAAGTVIGGSAGLPANLKESFRTAGITHILAASGYNFSVLLGFFGFLLFSLSPKLKTVAFLLIIPAFAFIAGATAAVIRAAVMGGLVYVALFSGRISAAKTALLWAAVLMLLLNPELLVFDIGFQLSFLATFGLILVIPVMENFLGHSLKEGSTLARLKAGFWATLFAVLAAQLATLPLLAYHFGTVSAVSVVVNLLVAPVIPFLMSFGTAAAFLGLVFPALGKLIALPAYILAGYVFKMAEFFTQFTWSQIYIQFSLLTTFIIYAGLFTAIVLYHKKYLKHRYA